MINVKDISAVKDAGKAAKGFLDYYYRMMKQKTNRETEREKERGKRRFLERIAETEDAEKEIKTYRREFEEYPEREESPKGKQ